MNQIYEVINNNLKEKYTELILRALPNWFGIDEGIKNYISAAKYSMFYVAENEGVIEGFISVKLHNKSSAEIISMGVLKEKQGKKVGTNLLNTVESALKSIGVKVLQVKTLGPSAQSEHYERTRYFYHSIGFYSLEENNGIWGVDNPCQIMVKFIAN